MNKVLQSEFLRIDEPAKIAWLLGFLFVQLLRNPGTAGVTRTGENFEAGIQRTMKRKVSSHLGCY